MSLLPPPDDGCVLIGTDNGFMIKRRNDGSYAVVYSDGYFGAANPHPGAHNYRSLQIEQISPVFNDVTKGTLQVEDEFASNPYNGWLSTSNEGDNWSQLGPPSATPPLQIFGNGQTLGLSVETVPTDEDGHGWFALGVGPLNNPPFSWHKTTDYNFTATALQFPVGSFQQFAGATVYVMEGFIWSIGTQVGVKKLFRQDAVTGGGFTSFNVPAGGNTNGLALIGTPGTHRLIAHATQNFTNTILSIDVTNPAAPVMAWGTLPTAANRVVFAAVPVTNQILVVGAWNSTQALGGIFRSVNGGTTWVQVQADTTDLKLGINPFTHNPDFGVEEDTQRMATTGGTEVWTATAFPKLYRSGDAGLTWASETVSSSIFGVTPPVHWLSVALICIPPSTVVTTVRRRPFGVIIS